MSRLGAGAALAASVLATAVTAEAQDLEPRTYASTPVGLNFLILGYGYTRGDVAIDASVPIEDAELTAHSPFLAYARALDVWGVWAAVDATYYTGGRTTIDGDRGERQENLRLGVTVAIPIGRHHSVKLYGSTGAVARAGGEFDIVGIAWQYRWGGGL